MEIEPGTESERRVLAKLEREMGPIVLQALSDPQCEEVVLNADSKLWRKRLGEPMAVIGTMDPGMAEAMMKTLASLLNEPIDRFSPLVNGELPFGRCRFAGALPPVAKAPTFAIRKPAITDISLQDYLEQGVLSPPHLCALQRAVREHQNILIMGGTGSGKTTLANALTREIVAACPDERIVILEDLNELRCSAENSVQWRTMPNVSMADLLRLTLRMRPDRIIVGEVRGAEALDLLRAWGTGHPGGLATLHANDAHSGLVQLETLVSMNKLAPSDSRIASVIAMNVHVVVHIAQSLKGRQVQEVLQVLGRDGDSYQTQAL